MLGVAKAGTLVQGQPVAASIAGYPALVDTGAAMSCISPGIAQALGLNPSGKRPMVSATHTVATNEYIVDLVVPFGNLNLVMNAQQVMEFTAPAGSPFQILMGRDLICRGSLHLSFDGHFTFSL
jgi:predicted aspartyl protease